MADHIKFCQNFKQHNFATADLWQYRLYLSGDGNMWIVLGFIVINRFCYRPRRHLEEEP